MVSTVISAGGRPVAAPGISKGRQSFVQVLSFRFSHGEELVVWKRMGSGKGLSRGSTQSMLEQLRPYRRSLRNHGWNVPKIFHSHLSQEDDDHFVSSFDQYIRGGDCDHLIRNSQVPAYAKWHVIRTVIETLAEYDTESIFRTELDDGVYTCLPHGLDLKLANLVSDGTQVWFVDLFAPKLLLGREDSHTSARFAIYDSHLDTLAENSLFKVTATREGAILRLLRLAELSWVGTGDITSEEFCHVALQILEESLLPRDEKRRVADEFDCKFAWLKSIYSEKLV